LYQGADRMYACPCGNGFAVPPGHCEPVLCGRHSPPEVMARSGVTPWSRPDADPLADLQEAGRLIEQYQASPRDFEEVISYATDQAVASVLGDLRGASMEMRGELSPEAADALGNEIRRGLPDCRVPAWAADAVEVWNGCKDAARRERSLAELAQDVADATPQIAPSQHGTDSGTAARWSPDDSGDVIL
jgi:hypothetical protein